MAATNRTGAIGFGASIGSTIGRALGGSVGAALGAGAGAITAKAANSETARSFGQEVATRFGQVTNFGPQNQPTTTQPSEIITGPQNAQLAAARLEPFKNLFKGMFDGLAKLLGPMLDGDKKDTQIAKNEDKDSETSTEKLS